MAESHATVGVLALQGDFGKHLQAFAALGVSAREVRTQHDLDGLGRLVIPGGESTTMTLLLVPELREAILSFCRAHPVWGTCAGMIMLARPSPDLRVKPFGLMDMELERNGYGRQVHSFEADLRVDGEIGEPEKRLHGVFIRAPRVKSLGAGVRPLVWLGDDAVVVRQGHFLASAFHPELTADLRLQRYFLAMST